MHQSYQHVCVIGLGYIGLPTAALLATKGFFVFGVDIKAELINNISSRNFHSVEPDLDVVIKAALKSGHLRMGLKPEAADVFLITVQTPFKETVVHNKVPDLSYVENAFRLLTPVLKPGDLVILESTSPVGTTESMAKMLYRERPELAGKIHLAYCPERVMPGQIIKELVSNDRIVGGVDQASTKKAAEFYYSFIRGSVLETNSRTAELVKLSENSFRDVNIAFANELSLICDRLGIDVWELINLANRHPRVNILQPGPGVGGHCIAVDPWFIVDAAPEEARIIRTAREINDAKPFHVVQQIKEKASTIKEPVIACLGLSFKADVDDLRESPALEIVKHLWLEQVGRILVVEPCIKCLPSELGICPQDQAFDEAAAAVEVSTDKEEMIRLVGLETALQEANIIVLLVNHRMFYKVSPELLRDKIIIDTRGVWE